MWHTKNCKPVSRITLKVYNVFITKTQYSILDKKIAGNLIVLKFSWLVCREMWIVYIFSTCCFYNRTKMSLHSTFYAWKTLCGLVTFNHLSWCIECVKTVLFIFKEFCLHMGNLLCRLTKCIWAVYYTVCMWGKYWDYNRGKSCGSICALQLLKLTLGIRITVKWSLKDIEVFAIKYPKAMDYLIN